MQQSAAIAGARFVKRNWAMRREVPFLARFLGKLVLDVLPAALASVIGGFLFTQYQFGHPATPQSAAAQAGPASAEVVQLVRDEHAMIVDFLKSQQAAQKRRLLAEDEADARAAAEAKAASAAAMRRVAAATVASKGGGSRDKAPAAVAHAPHAPLVIAQSEQSDGAAVAAPSTREPDSLVAKTLDLKDHVVAATRRMVSALGDIPSWIVDRIGGPNANSGAAGRQFSAAS